MCKEVDMIPQSVAIDTWGVDYVLLDENKNKLLTETGTLSPLTFQFFQKRPRGLRLDLAFDSGKDPGIFLRNCLPFPGI